MNFLKQKLNKKRSAFILSVFFLVFIFVFSWSNEVHAEESPGVANVLTGLWDAITNPKNTILLIIGAILEFIINGVGIFSTMLVSSIISIAQYNGFINEKSIVMAWTIIRDFSNMFFILILLVIAFATILRIESYNMKKWLPKLLIMAVLINFSRTIAGLIIDFSQVFMMTFISALGTGSGFVEALGIQGFFDMADEELKTNEPVNFFSTLVGMLFGLIYLLIATVVLIVIFAVLVMRIVMLWIYVVLSPLAFLLAAFPGGQKYSSRWWDEFIKQVITGPILAFFVWLALIASTTFVPTLSSDNCFGVGQVFCPTNFIHFVIAIGMLVGGLIITSQAGGAAGGIAGRGMGAINKGKSFTLNKAKSGAIKTGKVTGRTGIGLARGVDRNAGRLLKMEGGLVETSARRAGNLALAKPVGNYFKKKREEREERYKLLRDKQRLEKITDPEEKAKALEAMNRTIGGVEYKYQGGKLVGNDSKGRPVEIKALSEIRARMHEGSAMTNSSAWAAAKTAEDKKIAEEAEKAKSSGLSGQMLHRRAMDKSLSEAERKGAALALGLEADHIGSMSHKDVDEVRSVLGDNEMLQKKFDDSMVKKHAHKLYKLKNDDGSENEVGRKKLKKAIKKGKVDEIMDKSFYSDKEAMKVFEEATGSNFVKKLKRVAEHDDDFEKAVVQGLEKNLEGVSDAMTSDNLIMPVRDAMATITGNLSKALSGVNTKDQLDRGVDSLIGGMTTGDRAKIKFSSIDPKGSETINDNIDPGLRDDYTNKVNEALSLKITRKHLEVMDRTEGKDAQTIKHYEAIVDAREQRLRSQATASRNAKSGTVSPGGEGI